MSAFCYTVVGKVNGFAGFFVVASSACPLPLYPQKRNKLFKERAHPVGGSNYFFNYFSVFFSPPDSRAG
tara:strand:+ start:404 stop:610 length:207 start_codon:yes stop_codon:yes gene_type:complete